MWMLAIVWFGSSAAAPPRMAPATRAPLRAAVPRPPPLPAGRAVPGRRTLLFAVPIAPIVPAPTEPGSRPRALRDVPEPRRAPALPYVRAERPPTSIGAPGVLTPIDQLPSAFQPIAEAPNRLPVTRIRPAE